MSAVDAGQGVSKPHRRTRSRIASGEQLLPTVHPQSLWSRLFREERERLIAHCGGDAVISEPRRLAARRVAVLECELIHLEDQIGTIRAAGGEPEQSLVEYYGRLADRQRRQSEVLGFERAQRDVTPNLQQYAAQTATERAKAEATEAETE